MYANETRIQIDGDDQSTFKTTFDDDGRHGGRNYKEMSWFPAKLNMSSRFTVDPFGRSLLLRRLLAFPCDPAILMWGDGQGEWERCAKSKQGVLKLWFLVCSLRFWLGLSLFLFDFTSLSANCWFVLFVSISTHIPSKKPFCLVFMGSQDLKTLTPNHFVILCITILGEGWKCFLRFQCLL